MGLSSDFPGSAVFAFEGVALIIPVYDAMEHKSHMPRVLVSSMAAIALVTFLMGIFPYLAFGQSGIKETVIFSLLTHPVHH